MLVFKILNMVESSRNLSPKDYTIRTLKKISGVDAFQSYLKGEIKPDRSFSLEQKFIAILCGLGQITVPTATQDILEARSDDSNDTPAKEFLRGVKYSLDVSSTILPAFYLIGGSDFATTLVAVKIFGYNLVAAIAPDVIKSVKQRSSLQK